MRSVSVRRVERDRATNSFVITFREDEQPRRQFNIYIGLTEGTVIKMMLEGESSPRPLTHDLFVIALERISVQVKRVVLTHVSNGTYFAEITLEPESGDEVTISCRPSDATALALKANAPIYATQALLDEVGSEVEESEGESEEILDEFKEFIENISPEDFDI